MNIPLITIYDDSGNPISIPALKGSKGDTGNKGDTGSSAYQIAVANGFSGTQTEWLASLKGGNAYDVAVENGFSGTESEWLASLKGATGDSTTMKEIAPENDDAPPSAAAVYEALQNVTFDTEDFVEITQDNKIRTTIGDETNSDKVILHNHTIDGQVQTAGNKTVTSGYFFTIDNIKDYYKKPLYCKIGSDTFGPSTFSPYYIGNNISSGITCAGSEEDLSEIPSNITITGLSHLYKYIIEGDDIEFSKPNNLEFHIEFEDDDNIYLEPVEFSTAQKTSLTNLISSLYSAMGGSGDELEAEVNSYITKVTTNTYRYNCSNTNAVNFILNYYSFMLLVMGFNYDENETYSFDLSITPIDPLKSCFLADTTKTDEDDLVIELFTTTTYKEDYFGENPSYTSATVETSFSQIPVLTFNQTADMQKYGLNTLAAFQFDYTKTINNKPSIFIADITSIFGGDTHTLTITADDDINNQSFELYGFETGYKTLPDTSFKESDYIKVDNGAIKLKLGEQVATKSTWFSTTIKPMSSLSSSMLAPTLFQMYGVFNNETLTPITINQGDKLNVKIYSDNDPFGTEYELTWTNVTFNTSTALVATYNCTPQSVANFANDFVQNGTSTTLRVQKTSNTDIAFGIIYFQPTSNSSAAIIATAPDYEDPLLYTLEFLNNTYETIKLPSQYVDIDIETVSNASDIVTGSDSIPTAGAVADALATAGTVQTVNNISPIDGNIDLDISGAYWFGYYPYNITNGNSATGSLTVYPTIGTSTGGTQKTISKGAIVVDKSRKVLISDGTYWRQFAIAPTIATEHLANSSDINNLTVPSSYTMYRILIGDLDADTYKLARFKGTSSTEITDGGTQTPSGVGVIKRLGDIIFYNNTPFIWTGSTWKQLGISSIDYSNITNTPTLATVATSGSYTDLTNKPTLFSGSYNDLTDKPALFSGSYNELTNKPTLFSGSYNDLSDKPTLFSGSYNDLTNKPTVITSSTGIDNTSTDSELASAKAIYDMFQTFIDDVIGGEY